MTRVKQMYLSVLKNDLMVISEKVLGPIWSFIKGLISGAIGIPVMIAFGFIWAIWTVLAAPLANVKYECENYVTWIDIFFLDVDVDWFLVYGNYIRIAVAILIILALVGSPLISGEYNDLKYCLIPIVTNLVAWLILIGIKTKSKTTDEEFLL
jgi:hypothetical protein